MAASLDRSQRRKQKSRGKGLAENQISPSEGAVRSAQGRVRRFEVETNRRCDCCNRLLVRHPPPNLSPPPRAADSWRKSPRFTGWLSAFCHRPSHCWKINAILEFCKMHRPWRQNYIVQQNKNQSFSKTYIQIYIYGELAFTLPNNKLKKSRPDSPCDSVLSAWRKRSTKVPLLWPYFFSPFARWTIPNKLNDLALCLQHPLAFCPNWRWHAYRVNKTQG